MNRSTIGALSLNAQVGDDVCSSSGPLYMRIFLFLCIEIEDQGLGKRNGFGSHM